MGKKEDLHRSPQSPFRPIDPNLIAALDAYAAAQRRSRNVVINLFLERCLKEEGYWPWPLPAAQEGNGKE